MPSRRGAQLKYRDNFTFYLLHSQSPSFPLPYPLSVDPTTSTAHSVHTAEIFGPRTATLPTYQSGASRPNPAVVTAGHRNRWYKSSHGSTWWRDGVAKTHRFDLSTPGVSRVTHTIPIFWTLKPNRDKQTWACALRTLVGLTTWAKKQQPSYRCFGTHCRWSFQNTRNLRVAPSLIRRQGSSMSIWLGYGLDDWGSIPGTGSNKFYPLHSVKTLSCFSSDGYRGLIPWC
jgi:hypothetical protein